MGPGSPPGNHGNQSGSPGRRFLFAKLASGTETRVNVLTMIFIYIYIHSFIYRDLIIDIIVTPKHIVYLPMIFLENDVLDLKNLGIFEKLSTHFEWSRTTFLVTS